MIKGILFDMDGVLVDSEWLMPYCAAEAMVQWGANATPEDFLPYVGHPGEVYFGRVAEQYGIAYDPTMQNAAYRIYARRILEANAAAPGIGELLPRLKAAGYRLGVCSSALRIKVESNLLAVGPAAALFDAVLTDDDVVRHKPAPDIYLTGAAALGLSPSDCVAVEDSVNGVKAAVAAGIPCIALVPEGSGDAQRQAGACRIIRRLTEVDDLLSTLK